MKGQKLLMLLLALTLAGFMANCNGGGEEGDGDVEEDVQVDDVQVDDVTAEDIQPEEITVDDVPVEDVPAEEILPPCVSGTLTCTSSLTGETTVGATDNLNDYSCADLDESGGDKTYIFTSTEDRMVTIEMTPTSEDLDLYVMSGACDPATCIAYSAGVDEESLTFKADTGVTYYVTVDGWNGATDTYDITVTCALPETCDNGADDNGNLLIDCTDPECAGTTACTETACGDTMDNDSDGVADCLDPDCVEAANCYESSCSDTTDNDADTDIDCVDVDCFGDTACATGTAAIGDPCSSNTDCASGGCWSELLAGWPSGYCLTFGPDDCSTTCPSGSTCIDFSGGLGPFGCLQDCSSSSCTRAGYRCYSTALVCVPGCTDDAQCMVTGACNEYSATTGGGNCYPIAENCANSTDDDGDNKVDCADYDCMFTSPCGTVTALAGGDTCADAVALTMPSGERGQVIVSGTTTGMANDIIPPCTSVYSSTDVVYSFQLTAPAFVMVDVVGGFNPPMSNDTVISIRIDCTAGPDIVCNDDMETLYHSQAYGSFAAGTYYIVVDGYDEATSPGDFNMSVRFSDLP